MAEEKSKVDSAVEYYVQSGARIFIISGLYIVLGASFYQWLEKWSIVDSYFFVVVTLSTVGYGNIVPETNAGKIFTIFYIIVGIGIFSALISDLVRRSRERRKRKLLNKNSR